MHKNKVYWYCQLSGWFTVALSNFAVQAIYPNFNLLYELFGSLLLMTMGILFTSVLRRIYKHFDIMSLRPLSMLLPLLILSFICAIFIIGSGFLVLDLVAYFNQQPANMFTLNNWLGNLIAIYPLVLIWSAIYLAVQFLLRWQNSELDKAKLEAALKEAQLNTLVGQINPHFMFNSLNNIRALMLEDVDRAREMLTLMSKVLRYSLTSPHKTLIPLKEELETVSDFLSLAKIQLEERLITDIHINVNLERCQIPPMLLQTLVENAIKHGISETPGGGVLSISISEEAHFLNIVVSNPGDLTNSKVKADSTKLGVKNVQQRLNILYKNKASFKLEQDGNQVNAKVTLPL